MKPALAALAAFLLIRAFGLDPFVSREVETLLPVQVLVAEAVPGGVRVSTDNGLRGAGADYETAMARLEAAAPGTAFFGTCGAVVLCGVGLDAAVIRDARLRPNCSVYRCEQTPSAETLAGFLAVRESPATILDLRHERGEPARLIPTEGGWMLAAP